MKTLLELPDGDGPLYLRIVESVSDAIRERRLIPGQALPSSRALARSLEVHRNTVLRAYGELEAQGWCVAERARGTFVSQTPPAQVGSGEARSRVGFPLRTRRWQGRSEAPLKMLGGLPDIERVPRAALARAYRRALLRRPNNLAYGDPAGHPLLRETLGVHLRSTRGLVGGADSLIITRGSQQALFLLAQVLLRPGDTVLVESLGYRPAWQALASTGARLVPLRTDDEGVDVQAVKKVLAEHRVRAIYLTPHHQYPTTVTLSAARRRALLALAAKHRIALLEDDYDHEFHYEGRPILPLAAHDPFGVVVHIGTFSKVLAPGLRIGWVAAPTALVETLAERRAIVDRQGDATLEAALSELLEDGELTRHTLRMRRVYRHRRDRMLDALAAHLPELAYSAPNGGLAIWAKAEGIDTDAWAVRASASGVLVQSTRQFAYSRRVARHLRLGFASLPEGAIEEAVLRLAKARPKKHVR